MNRIRYIKNILLIFLLIIGSLFILDNVYAADDSVQVPQCTYQITQTIDGTEISGSFTVAYYKNSVTLWNTEKNKKASSISIGASGVNAKASLSNDGKSLFKQDGTSFSCPPSVQTKVGKTGRDSGKRFTYTITTKDSDKKYTATLSNDGSVVPAVIDGKSNAGNSIDKCSDTQLTNLKNELKTNFDNNLNTPVYSKVQELSNLNKYSNAASGQPVLTTIDVVRSKTVEITNYYNLLLTGSYGNKKQEIVEKYRNSCEFENDISQLKYIKTLETQLATTIKNVGKNKANQAETWMKEENISEETISDQKDSYEKGLATSLNNLQNSMKSNDKDINSSMRKIASSQEQLPGDCNMLYDIMPYLEKVFTWVKIAVPIALICFGIIDFSTPVLSGDKDALSKAISRFIKRCIIGIAIFFVPTLVKILLNIYNDVSGANTSTCGLATILIDYRR